MPPHALPLDERQLQALESGAEGWAAALQLAALARLEQGASCGDPAASLSGQRDIAAFLSEEVLAAQPPQVRDFLLHTSVLEYLSGPLCDAVTGRADGALVLEQLYRKGLFMVGLDDDDRAGAATATTIFSPHFYGSSCGSPRPAWFPCCTAAPAPGTPCRGAARKRSSII